jgi:predicted PurR-regulated permease PerM
LLAAASGLPGWIRSHRALAISGVLGAGAVVFLARFGGVLLPFLIAWVLAYLLDPVVTRIESRLERLSRGRDLRLTAVLLLYAGAGAAILAVGIPVVIALATNALALADLFAPANVSEYRRAAADLLVRYKAWVGMVPYADQVLQTLAGHQDKLIATTGELLQKAGQQIGSLVREMAVAVLSGGAGAMRLAIVPLALFYMLYDYVRIGTAFLSFVPRSHLQPAHRFLGRVDAVLGGYVRGQLTIICIAIAVFTSGLWLVGIRYAALIGPVAGLMSFIPYLGVFGMLPAVAVAFVSGGLSAQTLTRLAGIVVLCLVWQALEGLVLQPRLIGGAVALHPLLVLIALGLGGELAGIEGLMLAVPVAALLKVLWEEVRETVYGEENWLTQDV